MTMVTVMAMVTMMAMATMTVTDSTITALQLYLLHRGFLQGFLDIDLSEIKTLRYKIELSEIKFYSTVSLLNILCGVGWCAFWKPHSIISLVSPSHLIILPSDHDFISRRTSSLFYFSGVNIISKWIIYKASVKR